MSGPIRICHQTGPSNDRYWRKHINHHFLDMADHPDSLNITIPHNTILDNINIHLDNISILILLISIGLDFFKLNTKIEF